MAESKPVMARLGKLERDVGELKTAVVQIGAILVDQSERIDTGFRSLKEEFGSLRERLDRLIAVTIDERTASASRLLDIERRVSRLEERVGPLSR